KEQINVLWREFREAINTTYGNGKNVSDDVSCLRDYAENISWHDDLSALLGKESAEERRHRNGRPEHTYNPKNFSVDSAAKLLGMENARKGSEMTEMTRATTFLVLRQSAVEAEVIGFIIRENLPEGWRDAIASLDYAKLMQGGNK